MAFEGELQRAGIVSTTNETVITKDLRVIEDAVFEDDATISGDATVEGNLFIGGAVSGAIEGSSYVLQVSFQSGTSAPGPTDMAFLVVPVAGDGYVSRIRTVVYGDPGAAPVYRGRIGAADISGYDITIANGAAAGDMDDSGAIPSTEATASVDAGDVIKVRHQSVTCVSDVLIGVFVEITRT